MGTLAWLRYVEFDFGTFITFVHIVLLTGGRPATVPENFRGIVLEHLCYVPVTEDAPLRVPDPLVIGPPSCLRLHIWLLDVDMDETSPTNPNGCFHGIWDMARWGLYVMP